MDYRDVAIIIACLTGLGSFIVSVLTAFKSLGKLAVLFYRMDEAEKKHRDLEHRINSHDKTAAKTSETLALMEKDLKWIKKKLDKGED